MYTNSRNKVLTAAVLCSLLATGSVWATSDPPKANETVSKSNTADTPYSEITVKYVDGLVDGSGTIKGIEAGSTEGMQVFMADTGKITVSGAPGGLRGAFTSKGGQVCGIFVHLKDELVVHGAIDVTADVAVAEPQVGTYDMQSGIVCGSHIATGISNYGSLTVGKTDAANTITATVDSGTYAGPAAFPGYGYCQANGLYTSGGTTTVNGATTMNVTAKARVLGTGTGIRIQEANAKAWGVRTDLGGVVTFNDALKATVSAQGGIVNEIKSYDYADASASGIENSGTVNVKDLTIDATATGGIAPKDLTVKTNVYGIKNTRGTTPVDGVSTITVDGVSNITVAGQANAGNVDAANQVLVSGIDNGASTMTLKDTATITATATGANATVRAVNNHAYNGNGSTLTTKDLVLKATADGVALTAASAAGGNSIDIIGLYNEDSMLSTGNISLDLSASGGSLAADATTKRISVTAKGLYNKDSTAKSVSVGTVSGTVAAAGASATSNSEGTIVNAFGINNDTGSLTAAGTDLTVTATGSYGKQGNDTEAVGILNGTNGKNLTVTGTSKLNVAVTAAGTPGTMMSGAYGVRLRSGVDTSTVTLGDVTGSVQALTATNAQIGAGMLVAAGLEVAGTDGQTSTMTTQNVDLAVTATDTTKANGSIMVETAGLSAFYGTLRISGDAKVKTGITASNAANEIFTAYAVNAANNSVIDVGVAEDGTTSLGKTVQLEGDVLAYGDGKVNLSLDGTDSYLQGNVLTQNNITVGKETTSGTVNLTVTKGAAWRPVYDNRYGTANKNKSSLEVHPQSYTFADNSIGALALSNGGKVDLTWDNATRDAATAGRTLTIDTLSGDGGIFKINSNLAQNKADEITLGENSTSKTVGIDVAYDPALTASSLTKGSSIAGKALVLTDNSGQATVTGVADSYNLYSYTPTITMGEEGTWYLTGLTIDKVTPKGPVSGHVTSASQDRVALNSLWYDEANNLTKRMGDLRGATPAETGIWARYNHSKLEQSDTKLMSNLFQIGFDNSAAAKSGTIYRGLAVSHATGNADYDLGSGDVKETTLSLYQTGIKNDGRYYDVIAKIGKYSDDYDLTKTANPSSADYTTWAYSISGEYGRRFDLGHGLYVEPQAELILGRINGTDYTTSTGMKVDLNDQNRAITRLGAAVGKQFQNGSLYGRASYYHDFGSGVSLTAAADGGSLDYTKDLAHNWGELTLGGTMNAGKNTQLYGELTKYVGQLTSNIQFNIGARWKI